MERVTTGFAGVVHPFGGKRYVVSLKPEDVVCFVFWSKNFGPFLEDLKILDGLGYRFYFNYTVTALPPVFESNLDRQAAIDALKQLSKTYSPKHINWRFDPIIISSVCDRQYYVTAFERMAAEFEGLVERCYFSFVTNYGKVIRNFAEFEKEHGIKILDPGEDFKIDMANELADIAAGRGIQMYSCCGDYLLSDKIKMAHCIDGRIVEDLFSPKGINFRDKPTRKHCGCTESIDIGTYDTCPHGCTYCYANTNKQRASKAFNNHDKTSVFLGYTKPQSDRWLSEIKNCEA